jgi:flagellum-specific peptidoglycan hydrolase FlgJ
VSPLIDHRAAYIARLLVALDQFEARPPAPAWPLILAHAAYESGWGRTRQAKQARNHFNLSAGSTWRGPTLAGGDTEYRPGSSTPVRITQLWRIYRTDAEAIADYLRLLTARRYRPAREALWAGDAESFVRLLGPDRAGEQPPVGGYYTLPTAEYLTGFTAVLAEVRAHLPAEMPTT